MLLRTWIHRYPGVAALLEQDEDLLQGASVEQSPAQATLAILDDAGTVREEWYDFMRTWACAKAHDHGPRISLHCLVDYDLFVRLCDVASPFGSSGALRRPQGSIVAHLTLLERITVSPWSQCPPWVWVPHWSVHATQVTSVAVQPGSFHWQHGLPARVGLVDAVPSASATLCEAVFPARVCPCGGTLLYWC